jgi:hypothetical protein
MDLVRNDPLTSWIGENPDLNLWYALDFLNVNLNY